MALSVGLEVFVIHFAKLEKSKRLQRIYRLLLERGRLGATTLEITQLCDTVCAGSGVAELRANGKRIRAVAERETRTGRRVFRYFLEAGKEQEELRF